jgi:hypothetical protein
MVSHLEQTTKTVDVLMIQEQQSERKHQTTQLTRVWRVIIHKPETIRTVSFPQSVPASEEKVPMGVEQSPRAANEK